MVNLQKNIQWWWSGGSKTIEKPSLAMVPWRKNITITSFEKNDHRWSLVQLKERVGANLTHNEEGDVEHAGVEAEYALPTVQPHVHSSLFSHFLHSQGSLVERRFWLVVIILFASSFDLHELTPSRGRPSCLRCWWGWGRWERRRSARGRAAPDLGLILCYTTWGWVGPGRRGGRSSGQGGRTPLLSASQSEAPAPGVDCARVDQNCSIGMLIANC